MFKSITLGQYYQTDSLLHRLDPRTKVVMTLGYIISLFLIRSFTGYVVAGVLLAVGSLPLHLERYARHSGSSADHSDF